MPPMAPESSFLSLDLISSSLIESPQNGLITLKRATAKAILMIDDEISGWINLIPTEKD